MMLLIYIFNSCLLYQMYTVNASKLKERKKKYIYMKSTMYKRLQDIRTMSTITVSIF
jgi:hypothetical protein